MTELRGSKEVAFVGRLMVQNRISLLVRRCNFALNALISIVFAFFAIGICTAEFANSTNLFASFILISVPLTIGFVNSKAGAVSFALLLPVLNGFSVISVLSCQSPLELCFSSLALGSMFNTSYWDKFNKEESRGIPGCLIIIFISIIVWSFCDQLWFDNTQRFDITQLFLKSRYGFGDRNYFIHSTFLWLEGYIFYDIIVSHSAINSNSFRILPIVYAPVFTVFIAIEFFFKVPDNGLSFFLPLEDISSFGSFAASIFVYSISQFSFIALKSRRWISAFCSTLMLEAVVLSWSRASWLTAIVFFIITVVFKFRMKAFFVTLPILLMCVVATNAVSKAQWFQQSSYLVRLHSLVRPEPLAAKSSGRLGLYKKAIRMIQQRPMTGYGIGTFFLKSTEFGDNSDPKSENPNFAHNIFLQVAAELGLVGATAFVLCVTLFVLEIPYYYFSGYQYTTYSHLSLLLALGAYIETQMTANSLNVYASNQFLFWLLIAGLTTDKLLDLRQLRNTV